MQKIKIPVQSVDLYSIRGTGDGRGGMKSVATIELFLERLLWRTESDMKPLHMSQLTYSPVGVCFLFYSPACSVSSVKTANYIAKTLE